MGDVHQPLHDENVDLGGNDIKVTFGGTATNLHHIWDTNMPEKFVGGGTLESAQSWAGTLTTNIQSGGSYASQAADWLTGIQLADAVSTSMIWATDANAYVCSDVLTMGITALQGAELDGDYYTAAMPIIELQIAKGPSHLLICPVLQQLIFLSSRLSSRCLAESHRDWISGAIKGSGWADVDAKQLRCEAGRAGVQAEKRGERETAVCFTCSSIGCMCLSGFRSLAGLCRRL